MKHTNIRVLQVNVRLTEGGAAQVALALNADLKGEGVSSAFAYGYSKGGGRSRSEHLVPNAIPLTTKPEAAVNFLYERFVGRSIILPGACSIKKLLRVGAEFDIIHLHVVHSYYLNPLRLIAELIHSGSPVVWTMHDHWLVTGRCAITDGCDFWNAGCGKCGGRRNYPPSVLDFSSQEAIAKRKLVAKFANQCTFVSPSNHLAADVNIIYPDIPVKIIKNSVSSEFEAYAKIKELGFKAKSLGLTKIVVIANDLSYEAKTNRDLIRRVAALPNISVVTVGKNSPFSGRNIDNIGEIKSRKEMVEILSSMDAAIFSSSVDNFPLTICECLCVGLPVLATQSPASKEVLAYVCGRPMSEEEIVLAIKSRDFYANYVGVSSAGHLRELALETFGTAKMIASYARIYEQRLSAQISCGSSA